MTREEMLSELKAIKLRAVPTVATMDMGIQYDYATSEGAGTGFGGMGSWPAHMFSPIGEERWLKIRKEIKNHSLLVEDLEGTGLDVFLGKVNPVKGETIPSDVLQSLLVLPEKVTKPFYCFFDDGIWYDEWAEKPLFFESEEELKVEFADRYVDDIKRWDEMDDDELTGWYNRLQDDMSDFAICVYDSKEY